MMPASFSAFQIILVAVFAGLLVCCAWAWGRGWIRRRTAVLVIAFLVIVGSLIVWPNITTKIARILGIGRGADLILYCLALVTMIGFAMTYTRLHRLRRDITLLVRHTALQEAQDAGPATRAVQPDSGAGLEEPSGGEPAGTT